MTGKPSRAKGKKWSDESKKNKSGINHVMFNKTYDELYSPEKSKELTESFKGRIILLNPEKSEIAPKLKLKDKGNFAIKTR